MSQLVAVPCTASTCEEDNGQRFAASFALFTEDEAGAPTGVVALCGPCAASIVYHTGAVVKARPLASVDGRRLVWAE